MLNEEGDKIFIDLTNIANIVEKEYRSRSKDRFSSIISVLKKRAMNGNVDAQLKLGLDYLALLANEISLSHNDKINYLEMAKLWLQLAQIQVKETSGQLAQAICLFYGWQAEKNQKKAQERYDKIRANNQNNAFSCLPQELSQLTSCLSSPLQEIQKQYNQQNFKFNPAFKFETQYARALFALAAHYHLGLTVDKNKEKTFKYCLHAAQWGCPEAQLLIARYFEESSQDKSISSAEHFYTQAADQDYVEAQYSLVHYYTELKDNEQAFQCLKRAAENNHIEAQKQIIENYIQSRDIEQAIFWYNKCVQNNNNSDAQTHYELGKLCIDFDLQDYNSKAAKHFETASEQGHIDATYDLAILIENKNLEVTKDQSIILAKTYHEAASEKEHPRAAYWLGKFHTQNSLPEDGFEYFKNALQYQANENQWKLLPEEHVDTLRYMGRYYACHKNNYNEAEKAFLEAIPISNDRNYGVHWDLAKYCLVPQKQYQKALQHYNYRDVKETGNEHYPYLTEEEKQDPQEEKTEYLFPYNELISFNITTENVFFEWAQVLEQQGHLKKALQLYQKAANESDHVMSQNRLGEIAIEKHHHYSRNPKASEQNAIFLNNTQNELVKAVQKNHLKSKATLAYFYYENITNNQQPNQQLAYQYCNEILEKSSDERSLSLANLILGKINLYGLKEEKDEMVVEQDMQAAKYYFEMAKTYHHSRDTRWDHFLHSEIAWHLFSCDWLPLRCTIKNIPNSMLINLQQAACYNNIQAITLLAGYYNANEYKTQEYKCYHQLKKYGVRLDDASKNIIEQKQTFHSTRQYSQFFDTQSESIKVSYSASINWTSSSYHSYSDNKDKSNPALRTGPPWRCM